MPLSDLHHKTRIPLLQHDLPESDLFYNILHYQTFTAAGDLFQFFVCQLYTGLLNEFSDLFFAGGVFCLLFQLADQFQDEYLLEKYFSNLHLYNTTGSVTKQSQCPRRQAWIVTRFSHVAMLHILRFPAAAGKLSHQSEQKTKTASPVT